MRLHPTVAPIAAAVLLGVPAGADAASIATDLPCQVERAPVTVTGSGFTPDTRVELTADQVFETATTDATGAFTVTFPAPIEAGVGPDRGERFTLTATDDAGQAASTTFRSVQHTFGTSRGARSPKSKRTWSFSGFDPGKPVYGHFRHRGKSRGTYRFGVAAAPCGTLKKRAPGIPVKGRIARGTWTVYVDQRATFTLGTPRQLRGTTQVFGLARPRSASAADLWFRG